MTLPRSESSAGVQHGFCRDCAREFIIVHGRSVYGAPCKNPREHREDWTLGTYTLQRTATARRLVEAVKEAR